MRCHTVSFKCLLFWGGGGVRNRIIHKYLLETIYLTTHGFQMCLFFLLFLIFWLKANSATSAQLLNKFVPKNNRPMVTVRVHTIPTTNMDVYKMTYNSYIIICWQTSWLLTYKLIVVPALTGGMVIHLIANKIKGWLHRSLSLSLSLSLSVPCEMWKWVVLESECVCLQVFVFWFSWVFSTILLHWWLLDELAL